jgi:hypothetical protein
MDQDLEAALKELVPICVASFYLPKETLLELCGHVMEALYEPRDPLLDRLLRIDDYDCAYYRMRMMLDSFSAPQQELFKMWGATEQWNQFAQKHLSWEETISHRVLHLYWAFKLQDAEDFCSIEPNTGLYSQIWAKADALGVDRNRDIPVVLHDKFLRFAILLADFLELRERECCELNHLQRTLS